MLITHLSRIAMYGEQTGKENSLLSTTLHKESLSCRKSLIAKWLSKYEKFTDCLENVFGNMRHLQKCLENKFGKFTSALYESTSSAPFSDGNFEKKEGGGGHIEWWISCLVTQSISCLVTHWINLLVKNQLICQSIYQSNKHIGEGGHIGLPVYISAPSFTFAYPLIVGVIWAPQMTSQPIPTIFLCSPLPSGTWWTPSLSIPWYCHSVSSSACLVFFLLSLWLSRWFWPELMSRKHVHTISVCISLWWLGGLCVVLNPCWILELRHTGDNTGWQGQNALGDKLHYPRHSRWKA